MLKQTGVIIDCLTDMDMILFLESSIRGGVSFINQRHCLTGVDVSGQQARDEMLYIDANK